MFVDHQTWKVNLISCRHAQEWSLQVRSLILLLSTHLQGAFQMYVRARDRDCCSADDDLDDIFINMPLPVNTTFTEPQIFDGRRNKVAIEMRFRVICLENYYGANCTTFCLSPNSSYVCDTNGSLQCQRDCEDQSEFFSYGKCKHSNNNIIPTIIINFQSLICVVLHWVPVQTTAPAFRLDRITPVNVDLVSLDLSVRTLLKLKTVVQWFAQTIVCVCWQKSKSINVYVTKDLFEWVTNAYYGSIYGQSTQQRRLP